MLSKKRFQARLHGFCWTILETRDPNFNAEETKNEVLGMIIIKASGFASTEENEVIKQLLNLMSTRKESSNEMEDLQGALEGKLVVYKKLDPRLLLQDKDIPSEGMSAKTQRTLIIIAAIVVIFLIILLTAYLQTL